MRFPIFTSLIQILFPLRCRGCGHSGTALCNKCLRGIPLAKDLPEKTFAVFDYGNPIVRRAVRDLKYHAHSETAHSLAIGALPYIIEYLSGQIQSFGIQHIAIVPIPSHTQKLRERGFNQSMLLAQWWSEQIPDSHIYSLLKKISSTIPQATLNRKKRLQNVSHSMRCDTALNPKVLYVVIDDVITTGATCSEARRALTIAGSKKICTIALAHGYVRI